MRTDKHNISGKWGIVIKNSLYGMAGGIGGQAIAMLTAVIMARALGVEKVGVYNFSVTLAGIIFIILNMGLGGILQREISRDVSCAEKYLANTLFLRIFVAFPLSILIILLVVLLINRTDDLWIVLLTNLYIGLTGLFIVCAEPITAVERFDISSKYSLVQKALIMMITAVSLILTGSILTMLICYLFVMVLLIIAELSYVNKNICHVRLEFDKCFCRKYVAESFPTVLSASAEYINLRSDILILGLLAGDYESGLYSTATNIYVAASYAPLAIAKAATPTFNQMRGEGKTTDAFVRKACRSIIAISLLLAVIIAIIGRPAILLLFGESFEKSSVYLYILAASLVVMPLNRLFGYLLIGIKKQSLVAISTWVGAIFNIVSNIILINIIGPYAVAITTCLTEGFVTMLDIYFWRRSK